MKKIITLFLFVIMIGVVLFGSGSVGAVKPEDIKIAVRSGMISFGMENNASFLAPIPVTCAINPLYNQKPVHHQLLQNDDFVTIETARTE